MNKFYNISELSKILNLINQSNKKPLNHVLRYWEQEFSKLNPTKRRGNRRYYQHRDVILIRQIRSLLYQQGFTIDGARQKLSGNDAKEDSSQTRQVISQTVSELEELLKYLKR